MHPILEDVETALEPANALLIALAVLAFLLIPLEALANHLWFPRHKRPWKETLSNLGVGVGQQVLGLLAERAISVAALVAVSTLTPLRVPLTWWSWPLAFLAGDFVYYWVHRFEHRVRLGWAHHSVHHSDNGFDLSTSGRIAWVEALLGWYGLVPVVLLGFHPLQVLVVTQGLLLYQVWVHTQRVGRLGWLEGVLNTPSAHRVHHGANLTYLDANYGAVLMLWDRLFGTYVAEQDSEPVRYGLVEPIATLHPVSINLQEYRFMLRQVRSARSLGEALLWVLGPPDWSAEAGFSQLRPASTWRRVSAALERAPSRAPTHRQEGDSTGSSSRSGGSGAASPGEREAAARERAR